MNFSVKKSDMTCNNNFPKIKK